MKNLHGSYTRYLELFCEKEQPEIMRNATTTQKCLTLYIIMTRVKDCPPPTPIGSRLRSGRRRMKKWWWWDVDVVMCIISGGNE